MATVNDNFMHKSKAGDSVKTVGALFLIALKATNGWFGTLDEM